MPPFAPYFGNIHHGQIQHFQQATSTSRNATFIYGAGKRMTARSRQSEKCRREAIWLAEKPYRRSYPMVSTPEFDPDSGQTKMGQIWVNSQKKAKTTPEPRSSGVVLYCPFWRKNSAIYTKDIAKLVGCAGSIPQKGKTKPQVTKPGVFGANNHKGPGKIQYLCGLQPPATLQKHQNWSR